MAASTAYISFCSGVHENSAKSLMSVCAQAVHQGATSICLIISSGGGFLAHGFTVYNFLSGLPIHLITHNSGNIDSVANIIFLAGQERYACPHSTFLFHGTNWTFANATNIPKATLVEAVQSLEADEKRMADVIVQKTTLSEQDVSAMFTTSATKDATFAKQKGIVHDIKDLSIPQGAAVAVV